MAWHWFFSDVCMHDLTWYVIVWENATHTHTTHTHTHTHKYRHGQRSYVVCDLRENATHGESILVCVCVCVCMCVCMCVCV